MDLVDRVDVQIETGVWAVRSTSPTIYLLDTRGGRRQMMRLTAPESHSRAWWDDAWAPLVELIALPQIDLATDEPVPGTGAAPWVVRIGSRHKWVADPGGYLDSNEWWWASRLATSIERLDDAELASLLAEHGLDAGSKDRS